MEPVSSTCCCLLLLGLAALIPPGCPLPWEVSLWLPQMLGFAYWMSRVAMGLAGGNPGIQDPCKVGGRELRHLGCP